MQVHPQSFDLSKIRAKSLKIVAHKFRHLYLLLSDKRVWLNKAGLRSPEPELGIFPEAGVGVQIKNQMEPEFNLK